jgi:hypothetical protein
VVGRLVEPRRARALSADGTGNGEGPEPRLMRHPNAWSAGSPST